MPNCTVCKKIITNSNYKGNRPKCRTCRSAKACTFTKSPRFPSRTCKICNDSFYGKNADQIKCAKCKNLHSWHCYACDCAFTITSYGSPYGRIYYCDKCDNIVKKIRSGKSDPVLFNPKYDIEINFTKNEDDHDGYCSEPEDIRTSTSNIVRRLPCLKTIRQCDVDGDLSITNPNIIRLYEMESEPHGNGYCGCSTSYSIKSIKIVPAVKFPL